MEIYRMYIMALMFDVGEDTKSVQSQVNELKIEKFYRKKKVFIDIRDVV